MLNMFTLVVTQQFEEFYFNPDNPITAFEDLSEKFRKTWNLFTWKNKALKIKDKNLVFFFSLLQSPLGYRVIGGENGTEDDGSQEEELDIYTENIQTVVSRKDIARFIFKMDLPVDTEGYVPFAAVLHAAMKNSYGKKFLVGVEKKAYKMIR